MADTPQAFVAVTDNEWFRFLASQPDVDEVNFWQPGGQREFKAIGPGEPLLFKLHLPENYIVGGGFFAHASILPCSLAWEAFGVKNGTSTLSEMRARIEKYRRGDRSSREDYRIGCIILRDPFFFDRRDWITPPADFHKNIVQGKRYDLTVGVGRELWQEVVGRLNRQPSLVKEPSLTQMGYGKASLTHARLGQGAFRVVVTDIYRRRCAVTGEKALPALTAAHILPVSQGGEHRLDNGLLLRSDVHTLFDRGYVTITPSYRFRVSRRLKDDFDDGETYRRFKDNEIWLPQRLAEQPSKELLEWHNDTVFLK